MLQYMNAIRRHKAVFFGTMLVFLAVTSIYLAVRPVSYTSRITFYVSAQVGDAPTSAYQGSLLSQERVKSYVELFSGPRVSSEVVNRLGLRATPEELASRLQASSAIDSVLIDGQATDRSPEQAALIANTAGDAFTSVVADLERPVSGGTPSVVLRTVQPATVPTDSSSVSSINIIILGLLAGALVGFGAAVIRERADTTIKSVDDVKKAVLVPNLGTVPHEDPKVSTQAGLVRVSPARAEAYRYLRTNLQFLEATHQAQVLMVTSPMPGEGKTSTVLGLAAALAAQGVKTIIVDADLRQPRIAENLNLQSSVGLSNILAGRIDVHHAVQRSASSNVDVITSGTAPPNPAELLGSPGMPEILRQLRTSYEMILIDSPPVLPVTDAVLLAPSVDGLVLVCRADTTSRAQATRSAEALKMVNAPLIGTVLNDAAASTALYGLYGYSAHTGNFDNCRQESSGDVDADTETVVRDTRITLAPPRPTPRRRP